MREMIETLLSTSKTIKVKFTKADGTVRDMICTRDSSLVPKSEEKSKTGRTRKVNPDVCSVWDIESQGWRSFRYDSVISAQGE